VETMPRSSGLAGIVSWNPLPGPRPRGRAIWL